MHVKLLNVITNPSIIFTNDVVSCETAKNHSTRILPHAQAAALIENKKTKISRYQINIANIKTCNPWSVDS